MRAIVQRVSSASVTVDNQVVSEIAKGLMVLISSGSEETSPTTCRTDDTQADLETIADKILNLRVFDDANGTMWKSSVKQIGGDVLCVSQFTLLGNTTKGNKPDFHNAMPAESSSTMYANLLLRLGSLYNPHRIKDGKFGAMMNVRLTNEGPVTLTIDSRKFEYIQKSPSPKNLAK